jgi:hypothetical protein
VVTEKDGVGRVMTMRGSHQCRLPKQNMTPKTGMEEAATAEKLTY